MLNLFRRRQIMGSAVGLLGYLIARPAFAGAAAAAPSPPIRRVVTGIDEAGRSIIKSDTAATRVYRRGQEGLVITELWQTTSSPADNSSSGDPADGQLRLMPPQQGSVFRIIEFMPDERRFGVAPLKAPPASEDSSGIEAALKKGATARAPGFHTTNTTDYVVVLSGEIYALTDKDEVLLKAGDVLVQRGTNHAWSNRSKTPASLAFVLIDAQPLQSEGKKWLK